MSVTLTMLVLHGAVVDDPGSAMCCRGSAVSSEQGKGGGPSLRANKMLLTGTDSTLPGVKGDSLKIAVTSKPKVTLYVCAQPVGAAGVLDTDIPKAAAIMLYRQSCHIV